MSTLYFDSRKNYLKENPASDATTMLGPNTSILGGYLYARDVAIAHNLGYVPMCRVYYEPFDDGTIYPILSLPIDAKANNILGTGNLTGPGLLYWMDEDNLYIRLYYTDNSLAAVDFPIYYTIYEDFAL